MEEMENEVLSAEAAETAEIENEADMAAEQQEDTGEIAEQEAVERLAAEFDELVAQIPDVQRVEDLPDEVIATALSQGVTLTDAYLRHWYGRVRAAQAQQERQRLAAAQSAGRLGGVFDEPDPRQSAFSHAFRTALS